MILIAVGLAVVWAMVVVWYLDTRFFLKRKRQWVKRQRERQ